MRSSRQTIARKFAILNTNAASTGALHSTATAYFPTDGRGNVSTSAPASMLNGARKWVLDKVWMLQNGVNAVVQIRTADGVTVLDQFDIQTGTGAPKGYAFMARTYKQPVAFWIVSGTCRLLFEFSPIR